MSEQKTPKKRGRATKLKKETKTKDDNQAQTILTPEQQAILNRAEAETAEWETITEESMGDFSLSITPLDLKHNFPEAWKRREDKIYAFRWCERTDKRIDELTRGGHPLTRWKICTRMTTPFLSKYIDSLLGCITRLDQILLFRPYERHMAHQKAKEELAEAHANSGKPENKVLQSRSDDKVEAYSGPQHKIDGKDDVQYEDTRSTEKEYDLGDLVVEE